MCDYSMEHLDNVQAKEGERYYLDGRITHGFLAPNSSPYRPVAACVRDGMRLRLTNLAMRGERASHCAEEVTVIERRKHLHDPQYTAALGLSHPAYNDCLAFADGRVRPVAEIWKCDMEVLPVEVKPAKEFIAVKVMGYGIKVVERERELIDA